MNNLPNEILHHIFIQVPFHDRLECTLVCHSWYNYLCQRSLLYDLTIRSDHNFNKFIDMLKRLPSRGSQVEILELTISTKFDNRKLFSILPNLREFKYSTRAFTTHNESLCNRLIGLESINSNLQIIKDGGECELTKHLLTFSSCTRLRYLELMLNLVKTPRKDIFSNLKGAPALKTLILCYCEIGIDDLELIHKNVPALEDLELKIVRPVPNELPQHIIPAVTVRKFIVKIIHVKDYPIIRNWYRYLEMKYINLTCFDYHDSEIDSLYSTQLMNAYREGLFPIYRSLRIPFPRFVAKNMPAELNPFHMMDEFDLRLTNVNLIDNGTSPIFEQLGESNQSKHIELINMSNTVLNSPMMLQNFTSLRVLKLNENVENSSRWNVNLIDYFNAFPLTLTRFHATFLDAKISELPSHPNNIKDLGLTCSTLYPKLGETISHYFPRLDNLYLRGRVTENLAIHLPNNHFKCLQVDVEQSECGHHGYALRNGSALPRYCIANDGMKRLTSAEETPIMINITCASAPTLILDQSLIDY